MAINSYSGLRTHIGHKVVIVFYGDKRHDPENVAIECETCRVVLIDFDNPNAYGVKNQKRRRKNVGISTRSKS